MTSTSGPPRWWPVLGVAALVVAFDQLTKHWALGALADDHVIDVIGSLRFNLAFNSGASFSMGEGMGPVLAVIVVVVVVALLRFVRGTEGRLALAATGLVVGGAIGNLVDRIFRSGDGVLGGRVVDFIDLQWWPIFNVADMAVVGGAILLLIATWTSGIVDADDESNASTSAPPAS